MRESTRRKITSLKYKNVKDEVVRIGRKLDLKIQVTKNAYKVCLDDTFAGFNKIVPPENVLKDSSKMRFVAEKKIKEVKKLKIRARDFDLEYDSYEKKIKKQQDALKSEFQKEQEDYKAQISSAKSKYTSLKD